MHYDLVPVSCRSRASSLQPEPHYPDHPRVAEKGCQSVDLALAILDICTRHMLVAGIHICIVVGYTTCN